MVGKSAWTEETSCGRALSTYRGGKRDRVSQAGERRVRETCAWATHLQPDPCTDRVPQNDELWPTRRANLVRLGDRLDKGALVRHLVLEARQPPRVEAPVLVEPRRVPQVTDGVQLGVRAQVGRERVTQRGEEGPVERHEAWIARNEDEDELERRRGVDGVEGEDVGGVTEVARERAVAAAEGGLGGRRRRGGEGGENRLGGGDRRGDAVDCAWRCRRGGGCARRRGGRGDDPRRGP